MSNWLLIVSLIFQSAAIATGTTGVVSGRVRSPGGEPRGGISVMVMTGGVRNGRPNLVPLGISIPGTLTRSDAEGHYRLENIPPGHYYILASTVSNSNGEVPTLYPGVTRFDEARQIEVHANTEIDGIDFSIVRSRVVTVRGRVFNSISGVVSRTATVNLKGGWLGAFRETVDANGVFEFKGVPPGEYVIWTEDSGGRQRLFTTGRLTIPDNDVDGLELVFRPPLSVPGRFILEGGAAFSNPGMTPGVTANIVEGTLATGTSAGMDGNFELGRGGAGLVEGEYWITVDHLPGDLYVTSMTCGPIDLLKETLKLSGRPMSALVITLGTGTRLQGEVFDEKGQPGSRASVYLVPAGREPHLVRVQQTDVNGGFDIRGVAPGDYTVFAIAQAFPGAEQDPNFIHQYDGLGTQLTISRDGHPALNLKLLQ